MSPQSSAKTAMNLCEAALKLPTEEQDGYLRVQCKNDNELFEEASSLLSAIGASEEFLIADGDTQFHGAAAVGDHIGDYQLLEIIGKGGMGTVFRAERTDPLLQQQVALKIVNAQLLTPELSARFSAERDILASLQHPYIAGLVDGGTTANGVPYLVMEFIQGIEINDFCDQHQLSINARIELIEK